MNQPNPYQSPNAAGVGGDRSFQKVEVFAMNQRIGRLRYLAYSFLSQMALFFLLAIIGGIIGVAMGASGGGGAMMALLGIVYVVFLLAAIFIGVVLGVRRLHDLDKSGWLWLLFLVPIVNLGMTIYLLFFPGTEGENQFGLKPEPNTAATWVAGLVTPIVFVMFIGILAAISIPAYQDYVERARQAQSQNQD